MSISVFAQRDTIPLNDPWQFVIDKKGEGMNAGWEQGPLKNAEEVLLPHTWNVVPETETHYGWGWYQQKITAPASWKNKEVVLQFGAVNHTAVIYVNGRKVTEHLGDGYNKFFVPLSGHLIYGKQNTITVACNNAFSTTKVPFGNSFDWPNDGGIIRPVCLIVSGKPAAAYLHATTSIHLADSSGTITLKAGMRQAATSSLQWKIKIWEEHQPTAKQVFETTVKPQWNGQEATAALTLPKVNPWHFDFPHLYRVELTVIDGKKATDQIAAVVGFRDIRFSNGQTFLNGERIKLMGVEWTAGSNPNFGLAEPASEIIRHGKLMKDVNCIFTRVHFQQDDSFYDFCDRQGILVQEEVPLWGGDTPANDTMRTIAHRQLEAMIRNHYNHPSIITWGVGNELRGRDEAMKQMIAELLNKAKMLDPTRFNSYVSNTLTWGFKNHPGFTPDAGSLGSYIMMNEYGGSWWDLPTGSIGDYMDSVHQSYPDKPFFISEFGLCEPNFKGGDERRVQDLLYHMGIYESKPYVEGAIYFDLTDYRTHFPGTNESPKYRKRIHGVYDVYGNPKPSMKVLRELSSPVEIQQVHHWKKGKLTVLLFGSTGLPQHTAKGYRLYLSSSTSNFEKSTPVLIPDLKPGERKYVEVDDVFGGKGVITIQRPTGFVVSQKIFE